MHIFWRPENNTHIYDENQGAQGEGLQLRITSGGLGNTHVVLENAILAYDFRVPEAPGGGGPVGRVARVSPIGLSQKEY